MHADPALIFSILSLRFFDLLFKEKITNGKLAIEELAEQQETVRWRSSGTGSWVENSVRDDHRWRQKKVLGQTYVRTKQKKLLSAEDSPG